MNETEFPVFLTLEELRELINKGLSPELWHKVNNAISIFERGEGCCEETLSEGIR